MTASMVSISDLRSVYPDGTVGANGVSLEIPRGESVAVVGANGAGKSTLLRHLNGTMLATSGSVSVDGVEISKG